MVMRSVLLSGTLLQHPCPYVRVHSVGETTRPIILVASKEALPARALLGIVHLLPPLSLVYSCSVHSHTTLVIENGHLSLFHTALPALRLRRSAYIFLSFSGIYDRFVVLQGSANSGVGVPALAVRMRAG